jgi:diacylglycerol O-acyltransferase
MSYSHYERLSALDATFLELEDENCHMHIGAVSLFDAAPVLKPDGGIDIDRIRALMEAGLHRVPRYRQRVAWTPIMKHPVWVDDARFNLHYHVRHTHLPVPGDERLLKRLVGRLMSQQLDRSKPLWEMWVVEGVEGNRFAIVTKVHHCMIDGIGSVELTGSVMRTTPDPDPRLEQPPPRWIPRPVPTRRELLLGEIQRRASIPLTTASAVGRALVDPRGAIRSAQDVVGGLRDALGSSFRAASPTPLNIDIGPHRRFDWTAMDLDVIKQIRNQFGGTVNDAVLAIASGALRRFLRQRGVQPDDLDFRAMLPVNFRDPEERTSFGNRVAMMVTRLPIDERDPRRRLQRVTEATAELKRSGQVKGVRTLEDLSDWAFTTLFAQFARLAARSRPYNVVVTNVPGPQFPVYVLGSPMRTCYPLVPLFRGQALGVALFSYDGRLYWGFNADWDGVPDLHDLIEAITTEFDTLAIAAGARPVELSADEARTAAETGRLHSVARG